MKRLLAAFVLLATVMVFSVGTPGCTKKEPTKDIDKKVDSAKEPKKAPPKEVDVLEDAPKSKKVVEVPVPPIVPPIVPPVKEPVKDPVKEEVIKEQPKKSDAPKKVDDPKKDDSKKTDAPKKVEPELELPKDEPKKGASLDRPLPWIREVAVRESISAC